MTTKYFASTMGGMAGMTNAAGQLISVLDACLKDGFGSVTATSLIVDSDVATLTVSGGHGFLDNQVILIEGATPSGLNGEWRITRASSTECTFTTSGISDQTATGTITAKTAPLGWTKPYSDTNKAVYRNSTITGTGTYLRIDDSATSWPRARGYITMSDVDTGTDPFPTDAQVSGGAYFHKSTSSSAHAWFLVGTDLGFYLCTQVDGTSWNTVFFGDILSIYPSDVYRAALHGTNNTGASYISYLYGSSYDMFWMPRNHLGTGTSVRCAKRGPVFFSGYNLTGSVRNYYDYPSPANSGAVLSVPALVEQYQGELRGRMPGYVVVLNNAGGTLTSGTILSGVTGFNDPIILLRENYSSYATIFGVSLGDWT